MIHNGSLTNENSKHKFPNAVHCTFGSLWNTWNPSRCSFVKSLLAGGHNASFSWSPFFTAVPWCTSTKICEIFTGASNHDSNVVHSHPSQSIFSISSVRCSCPKSFTMSLKLLSEGVPCATSRLDGVFAARPYWWKCTRQGLRRLLISRSVDTVWSNTCISQSLDTSFSKAVSKSNLLFEPME